MSEQDFGSTPPNPEVPGSGETGWGAPQPNYSQTPPPYAQQPPPGYTVPPQGSQNYGPPSTGLSDSAAGAIAYITIIPAIVFLLIDPYKNRPFVRFHSVQCLVLAAFSIIAQVVVHLIPFMGFLLGSLVSLLVVVLWVIALVQAAQGKLYKLPVLGDIAANLAKTQA